MKDFLTKCLKNMEPFSWKMSSYFDMKNSFPHIYCKYKNISWEWDYCHTAIKKGISVPCHTTSYMPNRYPFVISSKEKPKDLLEKLFIEYADEIKKEEDLVALCLMGQDKIIIKGDKEISFILAQEKNENDLVIFYENDWEGFLQKIVCRAIEKQYFTQKDFISMPKTMQDYLLDREFDQQTPLGVFLLKKKMERAFDGERPSKSIKM